MTGRGALPEVQQDLGIEPVGASGIGETKVEVMKERKEEDEEDQQNDEPASNENIEVDKDKRALDGIIEVDSDDDGIIEIDSVNNMEAVTNWPRNTRNTRKTVPRSPRVPDEPVHPRFRRPHGQTPNETLHGTPESPDTFKTPEDTLKTLQTKATPKGPGTDAATQTDGPLLDSLVNFPPAFIARLRRTAPELLDMLRG